jgi:hypothetical protein
VSEPGAVSSGTEDAVSDTNTRERSRVAESMKESDGLKKSPSMLPRISRLLFAERQ